MKIMVVGGKLQGVEAAYLARKCGWEVVLVDKDFYAPASGLCDEFYCHDVFAAEGELARIAKSVDLIIPALENSRALQVLQRISYLTDTPLTYDDAAYQITSSKKKSNLLFAESSIPMPKHWPGCAFPVFIKPSGASGSDGVMIASSVEELNSLFNSKQITAEQWVIQEFAEGPSFSLEVMGCGGEYSVIKVTDLAMDWDYDCKRVTAPSTLEDHLIEQFAQITVQIARAINLTGIMDVEVILHDESLKVLEIDARLPSQTPTVVFHSVGLNFIELLYPIHAHSVMPQIRYPDSGRGVIFEHIIASPDVVVVCGEHIMADGGPLFYREDFFGADEAITNYEDGKQEWVATLITTAENLPEAWFKRNKVVQNILDFMGGTVLLDRLPGLFNFE